MTKTCFLVFAVLILTTLMPYANASFARAPTFDLVTTSNFASATDAVYTLHLENPDTSEDAVSVSLTIPAGYSIPQNFITNKAGVQAGSLEGECPVGSGQGTIVTTTTPGKFAMNVLGLKAGDIMITQPTQTQSGKIDLAFTMGYSIVNHGCRGDLKWASGFFINPSAPGDYAWAPSTASPSAGQPATMTPRSGQTQVVSISGSATSTTEVPEFPSLLTLILVITVTLPLALYRKRPDVTVKS